MKTFIIYLFLLILPLAGVFYSCTNSGEIECCSEDDDSVIVQRMERILRVDTIYKKVQEVRYSKLTIQIGAFISKQKAEDFLRTAKDKLKTYISIKISDDGWYKIFVGDYDNLQSAKAMLETIKNSGYMDAFIRDEYGPVEQ